MASPVLRQGRQSHTRRRKRPARAKETRRMLRHAAACIRRLHPHLHRRCRDSVGLYVPTRVTSKRSPAACVRSEASWAVPAGPDPQDDDRSSARTWFQAGERSAATTPSGRHWGRPFDAPSLGWTSKTCSPAETSCPASRWPSPSAPSTAQVRSGQAAAHSSSVAVWRELARTLSSPSGTSAGSIATAVCDLLWGPLRS